MIPTSSNFQNFNLIVNLQFNVPVLLTAFGLIGIFLEEIRLTRTMEKIDKATPISSKIVSTLHDILSFTEGSDIVLIGAVGSWGDLLSDKEVFDDVKAWGKARADKKEIEKCSIELLSQIFLPEQPTASIARLLITIFDILTPKDTTVQEALQLWIDEGAPQLVFEKLDAHLGRLLGQYEDKKDNMLNFYRKKRTERLLDKALN